MFGITWYFDGAASIITISFIARIIGGIVFLNVILGCLILYDSLLFLYSITIS